MERIRLDKRNFRHRIDAESTPDGDGIFCLVRLMAPCLKLYKSRPVFGFVVNLGNATAADVLNVISEVKKRVQARTGVLLEPEVRIIGEKN